MAQLSRAEIQSLRSQLGRGYIIAKEEGDTKLAKEMLAEFEKFDARHGLTKEVVRKTDAVASEITVRWRFGCGHMGTRSIPMKPHYMGIATTHIQGCGSPNIYFEYRVDKYGAKDTYGVCKNCGGEWFAGDFDSYK